ncbi:MAG: NAD-dependent epimerase/dehydratase family protein [Chloroflexi bacterium]|nr:NAD-dependent epimerase/dehydratase family protein [Chloroflexota bacterium]
MNFLVTGGTGFIGAALANYLVAQGHQVRAIDDLSAGSERGALDARVLFTRGDVRDIPKLWSLLNGVDCVCHLAARVSVPESVLYPVEYNQVNVGGTVSLMAAVRDAGVKRVVLASSGAIYGEQLRQPISETAALNPQTPYAVSKLAAEQYVLTIGALWKIETVILRIFNAYGPGQPLPPTHAPVIPRFLKQVITGGSLVVYGGGHQTRDFVYIDDVVRAMAAAAQKPGLNRVVLNVGSGTETSLNQLIRVVEDVAERNAQRIDRAHEGGGVSRLVADVSSAGMILDFAPQSDLRDGLRRMMLSDEHYAVRQPVFGLAPGAHGERG